MSNKSQEILDAYKANVMPTYAPSVVLASGKGITVRDVDGLSYYDFTSGIGVQAVGYSNKKVVAAIQKQAAQMTHCSNLYVNEPSTRLAAKLVEPPCTASSRIATVLSFTAALTDSMSL